MSERYLFEVNRHILFAYLDNLRNILVLFAISCIPDGRKTVWSNTQLMNVDTKISNVTAHALYTSSYRLFDFDDPQSDDGSNTFSFQIETNIICYMLLRGTMRCGVRFVVSQQQDIFLLFCSVVNVARA